MHNRLLMSPSACREGCNDRGFLVGSVLTGEGGRRGFSGWQRDHGVPSAAGVVVCPPEASPGTGYVSTKPGGQTLSRVTFAAAGAVLIAVVLAAPGTVHADTAAAVGEPYFGSAAERDQSPSVASAEGAREQAEQQTHVVQAGDTLWGLSQRYHVSVDVLARVNGLRVDSVLPIGLQLTIPVPEPEESPHRRYIVQAGDSLWKIARQHETTAQALADLNGLRMEAVLPVGAVLLVPAGPDGQRTDGQSLVEAAMQYRGVRYRYGGMTSRGMDCSGLVARVLATQGIDAPHNSRALYRLGHAVSCSQLQPGDLVFFNTNGRGISHVGIYVGEGKFIHASSGRGRVRIDTLEEGYYFRKYVGARRID